MKLISTSNYEKLSQLAAEEIILQIKKNPSLNLGLATGSTPTGLYKELIRDHKQNKTSYKEMNTFNLDEYIGIPKKDRNSYHYFMCENLFEHIDIPLDQTHIPDGTAKNLDEECSRYEQFINEHGGIDLQILGIGQNGHIGFNEPGTPFDSRTHIIDLAESTRKANARFFESLEDVPKQAITMGIASIMDCKEIFLLVSGASKAKALARLMNGEINEQFPASVLKTHQNVTIFADKEATAFL
ncbi:glucosamine-6-phosphate deaminase [Mesobacillus boroniphilus]|uniref:Glucosamine-6-phosphate deaminase n=1 Tax=Mesobacillus boroniphilus TaxID=308892 RepID=A0A944CMG4_9BACI|nr:glucosamine-6-phosphate deaminase [Mesobacillus boroniphilus]MBS8265843.1 glucosamine-6-phosphate deaminase [Mesobacillus boroniphilus]